MLSFDLNAKSANNAENFNTFNAHCFVIPRIFLAIFDIPLESNCGRYLEMIGGLENRNLPIIAKKKKTDLANRSFKKKKKNTEKKKAFYA